MLMQYQILLLHSPKGTGVVSEMTKWRCCLQGKQEDDPVLWDEIFLHNHLCLGPSSQFFPKIYSFNLD
jgi:hypothetical protein